NTRQRLLALMTVYGQCYGDGRYEGTRTKALDGLRSNTLRPKAPGNGYLPPPKNKKMARNASLPCCKNRTRQYSGTSRLRPPPTRMTLSGNSISSPDGASKC